MLKAERQAAIIKQINLHNKVLSTDLSHLLKVSEDTIRRDLKELDQIGKISKVHGGAVSKSFHYPFADNSNVYAQQAKQQIAAKTLKLLKNEMTILTGGGTSMQELAKIIPRHLSATVFTISPLVTIKLAEHPNLTTINIGGQLCKNSSVHIGAKVINQLADIKADLCILGTNGLSVQEGITESDWEIVQVKKAMIRSSAKLAIISIAEKLNTSQRLRVCNLNEVDYLITELDPAHALLTAYQRYGLHLL